MENTNPSCFRIRDNNVSVRPIGVPDSDDGGFSTWTLSRMNAACRVRDLDFQVIIDKYVHPLTHHLHAYFQRGERKDH